MKSIQVIFVAIAAFFVMRGIAAMRSGKIYVGWVFEEVIAERSKSPLLFWFMVVASLCFALFIVVVFFLKK